MEVKRQIDIVHGYVRSNFDELVVQDIIRIIWNFYLIRIASNILSSNEQSSFMNLLFNRLKQQKGNENIKSINTKLLYRASDNNNECHNFHEMCDDKGATISIIHNEHNHIFGGYASKSWKSISYETCCPIAVNDSNVFLYSVRPNMKCIELTKNNEKGYNAISGKVKYGPIYGEGPDLCIYMHQDKLTGFSKSKSFEFSEKQMTGVARRTHFLVLDFEMFSVTFE